MRNLFKLITFFPLILLGQYEVLEVRKVRKWDGEKVRKGALLQKWDTVSIAEKGYLTLDVESAMHLKLASGVYNIGQESKRHNKWYNTHLKHIDKLKSLGLISCKFRYKTIAVPGSNRHYEVDRIEIDQPSFVEINNDTTSLCIKWANPNHKYNGKYYLVVRDFYNEGFIDILETSENQITIYPSKYDHKYMYYSVIAETCRASLRYKVQVNRPTSYYNSETNFLTGDK